MELFSCCLSQETATALSIIDPFDVTVELHKLTASQHKPAHKAFEKKRQTYTQTDNKKTVSVEQTVFLQ